MVSRRGQMLGVLAGLLVLSGCSPAEGEETPTPPVSQGPTTEPAGDAGGDDDASGAEDPSEDPSQPPEVDAPERPAEMDEESVDGAIAAAKYFMELMPYAIGTGDTTEWDALSLDGCSFCESIRTTATEVHEGDGYATGGAVEIYSEDGGGPYEDSEFEGEDVYIVALGLTVDAMELRYQDGTVESFEAGDRPEFMLSLVRREGAWLVTGVDRGDQA